MGDTNIPNGDAAARRTVQLMRTVSEILPPQKIVDVWNEVRTPSPPNYSTMWTKVGTKTGKCMAEGALLLASLWQSASVVAGMEI